MITYCNLTRSRVDKDARAFPFKSLSLWELRDVFYLSLLLLAESWSFPAWWNAFVYNAWERRPYILRFRRGARFVKRTRWFVSLLRTPSEPNDYYCTFATKLSFLCHPEFTFFYVSLYSVSFDTHPQFIPSIPTGFLNTRLSLFILG